MLRKALLLSAWAALAVAFPALPQEFIADPESTTNSDFNTDLESTDNPEMATDIESTSSLYLASDLGLTIGLELDSDVKSASALEIIRDVESTTDIYLENTEPIESSTHEESTTSNFEEQATEATSNVTAAYSKELMTEAPESEADLALVVTITLQTTTS
ncbi:Nitric Oxide Synthase, Brain [Manis pentadactyla]|nr:Nitric Oxide Synthase, Brain [Manis pentadactyla]